MTDFETILGAVGARVSAAALDRAYNESGTYLARVWSRYRDVPVDDHVRAILAALDPGLPRRVSAEVMTRLVDAYSRPALLVPPAVDDGALAALTTLASRGYTLALVSNIMRTPGATLRKLLERYGLLGCFKHTTFSDEVGVRKPDPEIFALTLRAVGGEPAAAVHVGDDEILDVHGARRAGMRAIQVTNLAREALGAQRPDEVIRHLAALPAAIERLES
jgi:HAD superfamily hydrolase (TIGR01509 family)